MRRDEISEGNGGETKFSLEMSETRRDSIFVGNHLFLTTTIEDLLPLGVTLNIPPFLGSNSQMTAEDVIKTQEIASVRIPVERAINKIKNFHLWDSVVPLSLFGVVSQMWSVCAFLCNIQDPLIST